jgi:hypothetical protein
MCGLRVSGCSHTYLAAPRLFGYLGFASAPADLQQTVRYMLKDLTG